MINDYNLMNLIITLMLMVLQDDYELTVRIIYCADWPRGGGSGDNLIQTFDVLKVVRDWHLEYQRGPLVVVDRLVLELIVVSGGTQHLTSKCNFRFGGTESATFCALTTLCNQLETDNAIDVYFVAKLFHDHRPGIWTSKVSVGSLCSLALLG